MPRTPEERAAPFITTQNVITKTRIIDKVFPQLMFLTYGVYLIVFGLAIYVLTHRRNSLAPRLYLWFTVVLFTLNTIFVTFNAVGLIHQTIIMYEAVKTREWEPLLNYLADNDTIGIMCVALDVAIVGMNVIADWMLIHRCYVIWESRKMIAYPLAIISVIINGLMVGSYVVLRLNSAGVKLPEGAFMKANNINNGAFIAAAGFNFLLTLITAGRIWYITREARKVLGSPIRSRYKTIVSIIMESGSLYTVTLLATIILYFTVDPKNTGGIPVDLAVLSTQLSGLAPTIIIVRVAYSQSVDSVQQVVSTLNFASRDLEGSATVHLESRSKTSISSHSPQTRDLF
ncbi:hypothetical protein AAF712_012521 [Marasmius tenuissimus]|uniref:Gustatory receptor n=1 Tax=Marasmius tenuissimus TaxID=585030 RepID=A0ABR2ZH70_9AGAR